MTMTHRLRIGLLFGGDSVEHEVSVMSARSVAAGFDAERIECVPIGVTGDGRWLSPEHSAAILASDGKRVEAGSGKDDGSSVAALPGGGGLMLMAPGKAPEEVHLDAAFPVIHGWGGEDGRLQGLLELAGIPCVGAGLLGSAVAMDKEMTRTLLAFHDVPMAPWRSLRSSVFREYPEASMDRLTGSLGLPLFVKPANGGSSVGISRVDDAGGLRAALELAFRHDRKAVVEKALDAREIECAVLGNELPEASIPGEIIPAAKFYTYEDKYLDDKAELIIPAVLDPEGVEKVRDLAVAAFRVLDLAGMARMDFLLERETGEIHFNEANTLPGFTPISMYSKLWEASGVGYSELLGRLVDLAIGRASPE
jgi:D-alanine-D-alanine ligase